MLHKCANSECKTVFRSLSCGKLFQIESHHAPPTELPGRRRFRARQIERYWLCERCSASLTLMLEKSGGILAVPLPAHLQHSPVTALA
jgi:hypothetical protein